MKRVEDFMVGPYSESEDKLAMDLAISCMAEGMTFDEFEDSFSSDPLLVGYSAEDAWLLAEDLLEIPHANVHPDLAKYL